MTSWDGAKYAFVVPRFGRGIAGGAETLVGELARRLAMRGDKIDVLTTCAKDNRTWDNVFPEAESVEDDVRVLRFSVRSRDTDAWVPLQIRLSEGLSLTLEEELLWMEHSVNADGLYRYIKENAANYKALFFAPYLFGTTFWGSLIYPQNSILIPCLHDESYAYTKVIQSMFRQVRGCLFNASPEGDLAWDLYGAMKGAEVGMGFEEVTEPPKGSFFKEEFPYLLYLGRKETGKNAHLLVQYFMKAKDEGRIYPNLKLVIVGGGSFSDLHLPQALERSDIFDVAHVSEDEKKQIIKNALCLVQPSRNESFSIVIMESWLLDVPVLVHGRCAVTKFHVEESGGGLYFGDFEDFCGVVERFSTDNNLRTLMGRAGHAYVSNKYNWDAVLKRFDTVTDSIMSSQVKGDESREANR